MSKLAISLAAAGIGAVGFGLTTAKPPPPPQAFADQWSAAVAAVAVAGSSEAVQRSQPAAQVSLALATDTEEIGLNANKVSALAPKPAVKEITALKVERRKVAHARSGICANGKRWYTKRGWKYWRCRR